MSFPGACGWNSQKRAFLDNRLHNPDAEWSISAIDVADIVICLSLFRE